ncbi:MAG: hypothetical protein ACKPGI_10295 [Verrucomicrobiota bacterium]
MIPSSLSKALVLLLLIGLRVDAASGWDRIPEVLRPWIPWATWGDAHRNCPTPYSDPKTHRCFWPSTLELAVTADGARFTLDVLVYDETWVPLPGGGDVWPVGVRTPPPRWGTSNRPRSPSWSTTRHRPCTWCPEGTEWGGNPDVIV